MSMANQFLSLSLFVMLLSFFIILNAVSNFEEVKSRPVLNSIALTFANKEVEPQLLPNVEESPTQSVNEGDTLDRIDGLFNAHIVGTQTSRNRLGTVMHVRMPLSEFEKAVSVASSGIPSNIWATNNADAPFLPTLVSLLQTQQNGPTYRMDMVLNTAELPSVMAKDEPQDLTRNVEKAAFLSEKLEEAGVPIKRMSAALIQGDEGMIDIYFRSYEPFTPLNAMAEQ